ncbi:MAG: hypothetical protein DRN11_01230 [Thermoplasmata archaeon]|nr:MAG: hypothetical protein DRN11_01230 [Thermoplasmata archaeon]
MKEKEIELIPGSKYVVYSIGSEKEIMQTSGTFIGYSYLSKDEGGICIKMDETHGAKKGLIRIIPISMILAIDIIEEKKPKKKKEKEEATHYFS